MLTTSSRIRIQEILKRIAMEDEVTLEERIYISKYASRNQSVSCWLRRASNYQRNRLKSNAIDELLNNLDLSSSDPQSTYDPNQDDIGEWFSGAPSWVRRS
tara:strand:+ start:194 stop:496 length:303 start_codon:yes stop_codon:yes gene_type:complete